MQAPFLVFMLLPLLVGGAILLGILLLTRIMPGDPKAVKATGQAPAPARGPDYIQLSARRKSAYRLGIGVLLGLGALTIVEFLMAALNSPVLMFIMMVLKAALIMYFFMHIAMLWRTEEAH